MLTILASFAQEESRSISENVKWAKRKSFEQGAVERRKAYGYRWKDDAREIYESEAKSSDAFSRNTSMAQGTKPLWMG